MRSYTGSLLTRPLTILIPTIFCVPVEAEYFQLYKRTRHVFTEALRVLEFREVCVRAQATEGPGAAFS